MALRHHAVLAPVSQRYPPPVDTFLRVTHPSATNAEASVRLACVKHAASVHSEPGSNSQVHSPPDPERPSSSEPPCTHSTHRRFPNHPKITRHQAKSHPRHQTLSGQHPGADRASHPLTSSPPTSHQHQGRYHSHPSAQHPAIHTGQPRTKHFQNRCTCQRTTPDRPEITSGEVTIRQSSETPLPQRANEPKAPTPARQPRITSGVAGFYGPPRTMSNGFHAVSCNALDA